MQQGSRDIGVRIDRPASVVYDFAAKPTNLPRWASGLAGATVEQDGDRWATDSPMGRVTFEFAPPNDRGILDHAVTLPSGETVHNPMRVVDDGEACEVIFTLLRRAGTSEAEYAADAAAVEADLARLKALMER